FPCCAMSRSSASLLDLYWIAPRWTRRRTALTARFRSMAGSSGGRDLRPRIVRVTVSGDAARTGASRSAAPLASTRYFDPLPPFPDGAFRLLPGHSVTLTNLADQLLLLSVDDLEV